MYRAEFLHETTRGLAAYSSCDVADVWIRERGKVYRCEQRARTGVTTMDIVDEQEICPVRFPPEGTGTLADLCRMMLLNPDLSYPVRAPAFWTPDGSVLIDAITSGRRARAAMRVHRRGHYPCSACIVLRADGLRRGVLQLSWRAPVPTLQTEVRRLAGVAPLIAEAFVSRQMGVALRERVKELRCLYDMATIAAQRETPLADMLQRFAGLLPAAFLHRDEATARVVLGTEVYRAGVESQPRTCLRSPFVVAGSGEGFVEVGYCRELPDLDEGPFLHEERQLLDTVAREIALVVERKHSEDENARLQDQVRHADRLTMIGQLAASVAHELNEPMESILGFSQLLCQSSGVTGQTRHDIERVVQAALHAREVLRDLMSLARRTGGGRLTTNLNAIVEESLWYLRPRCRRGGVELVQELSARLPVILADPVQLHQVVINLAVNAIQAMPAGGTLTLRTRVDGGTAVLQVEDNGTGMTEEVRRKIFTPFFTTKGPSEGTGLGLTVVQGIVQGHGGCIEVHSIPGSGSLFEVRLPLVPERADTDPTGGRP